FRIAMRGLDGGRINIAACSLGGASACLETARTYVGEREAFGRKLADFQALQFDIADMATMLEASRLMVWRAAAALDAADPEATLYCAMAKRFATDAGFDICNRALQLHGGYGYLKDFPLERFVRDTRVHQILEGTNEITRVIIARRLLAQSPPANRFSRTGQDERALSSEEIRFSVADGVGTVTLDRPKALNAVTLEMVRALDARLRAWAEADDVHAVLIRSTSERSFAAGGDIRRLYEAGRS